MRALRALPIGAAVTTMAALQLGLAGSAQAADPSGYEFGIDWGGTDTHHLSVFAPGTEHGYSLTLSKGGSIPMEPVVDGNVLVVVRPTGSAQTGLPAGVTVDFAYGVCAGTGEPGVFLCDSTKPSKSGMPGGPPFYGMATVNVKIGADTLDRTRFDLDALIVPGADTTYAKALADQAAGKKFPAQRTQHIEVESKERVAKDSVAFETKDLVGVGTVVQTLKVHAEDSPDLLLAAESGDPKAPWLNGTGNRVDMVEGMELAGLDGDNGASCRVRPATDQHGVSGERVGLAQCVLKPGDTVLKATFKVSAPLKQDVKLNADYLIYSDKGDQAEFTRSATFAVRPAAATTAPGTSAPATPPAGGGHPARPSTGTAATTAAPATGTGNSTGTGSTGGNLASTGASGTGWYAGAAAALVGAGTGAVLLARRKRRSARA